MDLAIIVAVFAGVAMVLQLVSSMQIHNRDMKLMEAMLSNIKEYVKNANAHQSADSALLKEMLGVVSSSVTSQRQRQAEPSSLLQMIHRMVGDAGAPHVCPEGEWAPLTSDDEKVALEGQMNHHFNATTLLRHLKEEQHPRAVEIEMFLRANTDATLWARLPEIAENGPDEFISHVMGLIDRDPNQGLPHLEGNPVEVADAEVIRNQQRDGICKEIAEAKNRDANYADRALRRLYTEKSPKFWLEVRGLEPNLVVYRLSQDLNPHTDT